MFYQFLFKGHYEAQIQPLCKFAFADNPFQLGFLMMFCNITITTKSGNFQSESVCVNPNAFSQYSKLASPSILFCLCFYPCLLSFVSGAC